MDADLYTQLDHGLSELPKDDAVSPDELELPGISIIHNIRIELETACLCSVS